MRRQRSPDSANPESVWNVKVRTLARGPQRSEAQGFVRPWAWTRLSRKQVCMPYQVAAPPPPQPEHFDDYFMVFLFLRSILREDGNRWKGCSPKPPLPKEQAWLKASSCSQQTCSLPKEPAIGNLERGPDRPCLSVFCCVHILQH